VCRTTGARNDHLQSALHGSFGVFEQQIGRAMSRDDLYLVVYT
jgi:hypothetical protein